MPNDTGPVIGIDLGTTNSCVGVFLQDSNSCEILANSATGLNTTPSWVGYYDEDGKILIGRSARTAKTFVYDAKRMIGRSFDDAEVSKNSAKWPFKVERGSNNRCVIKKHDNTTVNVEEISQHVLMAMKQLAEARMQTEVKRAVITVPAYFNNSQIQATKDAARGAGLHTLRIMDEPTAAILAAGMADSDVDKLVLVFDWGGGTFDISILEITDAVSTEAKNGNMDLGGRDLDEALVDYCLMKFKEQNGGLDLSQDKNLRRRLFEVCEAAKIALSAEISYEIKVEQFHDNKDLILTISRDQFETIGQPIFQKLL